MKLVFPSFESFKEFAQNNIIPDTDDIQICGVLGLGNLHVKRVSNDVINTYGLTKIASDGSVTSSETIKPECGTIILYSKNNDLLSKATRYATKSIFTHISILLASGDVLYEALPSAIYTYRINGILQLMREKDNDPCVLLIPNKKIDIKIPTSKPKYETNMLSFLKLVIPYSIRKHFKTLTPHAQFCSEFIMNMLPFTDVKAENVSPGDFFRKEGDNEVYVKYIYPNYTPYFIINNERIGVQTFKIW